MCVDYYNIIHTARKQIKVSIMITLDYTVGKRRKPLMDIYDVMDELNRFNKMCTPINCMLLLSFDLTCDLSLPHSLVRVPDESPGIYRPLEKGCESD